MRGFPEPPGNQDAEMTAYRTLNGLKVAVELADFIEQEALPGTDLERDRFWASLADIIARFGPENRRLLDRRDALQRQIDAWHAARPGAVDPVTYRAFLEEIGYIVPEPAPFSIETTGVDPEIADVMPLTDRSFSVHGKKIGATTVSAYNAERKLIGQFECELADRHRAAGDIDAARAAIARAYAADSTSVRAGISEGRIEAEAGNPAGAVRALATMAA